MIWSYLTTFDRGASYCRAYGCPVVVSIGGQRLEVVYQFGGGGQRCAVVHWQSGSVIAPIYDHHEGCPEQRAQAAIDEIKAKPDRILAVIAGSAVVNTLPRVEGVM